MIRQGISGFTLSELLIALGILGMVSTFVIPKVLHANHEAQKKAVIREVYGLMSELTYYGYLDGGMEAANQAGGVGNYFFPRVNAIKLCPNNASTEGCWTQPWLGPSLEETEAGFALANGATVAGLKTNGTLAGKRDGFILDWNGTEAPNLQGQDQLYLNMVWNPAGFGGVGPGRVAVAPWGDVAANQALYEWAFAGN